MSRGPRSTGGSSSTRLASLDGLRGWAVVLVVLDHAGVPGLGAGGVVGVSLFFVLSGFLITGILLAELEATGRLDVPAFYLRRALRLVPALWLMLAVIVAVLVAWVGLGWPQVRGWVVPAATYLTDVLAQVGETGPFGHTWTLAVEEQFYLVWPALLALVVLPLRRRRRAARALLLVVLVALTAASVWSRTELASAGTAQDLLAALRRPDSNAFGLTAGAVLAVAYRSGWRPRPAARWAALPLAVTLAVLGYLMAPFGLNGPVWVSVAAAAVGLLLVTVSVGERRTVLAAGPLRHVGRVSYGWYLWHFPLIWLVQQLWPPAGGRPVLDLVVHGVPVTRGWAMAAAVLLSLLLAEASFWGLERPVLRLKRRFERSQLRSPEDKAIDLREGVADQRHPVAPTLRR